MTKPCTPFYDSDSEEKEFLRELESWYHLTIGLERRFYLLEMGQGRTLKKQTESDSDSYLKKRFNRIGPVARVTSFTEKESDLANKRFGR